MSDLEPFVAAIRFGYGARPGEAVRIARDPRRWLLEQLRPVQGGPDVFAAFPSSAALIEAWLRARGMEALTRFNQERGAPLFRSEMAARTREAAEGAAPFRERLVRFWSNHFTVSANGKPLRPFVGAFEREAIRPHVTGRFGDMLLAVVRHPVMLMYLDNINSSGPGSRHGRRFGRGLNENLAREILELHTLGVNGGYDQTDVVAFARILTGWRFADLNRPNPGTFAFEPGTHEPGPKTLLGRVYEEDGVAEGEAALRFLARHDSTAKHLARKLARHFVADDPPPAAVARLRAAFAETGGDLGAVARELVELPEVWADPLGKIKTPDDLAVSVWRLIGVPESATDVLAPLHLLSQEPFMAASPAGWPDTSGAWIGPESVVRRVELADMIGRRHGRRADPLALVEIALGPLASEGTLTSVRRARTRREAVTLLMASPEFQRR